MTRILITGGAGFVGSSLALLFKAEFPESQVICLDNLSRRGSELNLSRLSQNKITFLHGDVRNPEDLAQVGPVDWLIECSAEPSVHAGYSQSPAYLINTNLGGLINCLEFLRMQGGSLIFLSTSRVYPIASLRTLPLIVKDQRFSLQTNLSLTGCSEHGIAESFPLTGVRSLYGATKLSGELMAQEYAAMYGINTIINRCGVLAGAWQMGKVDQGFMALWVAAHYFGRTLSYMGFGGEGLQVRDVLHVRDLFHLLCLQMQNKQNAPVYNVGGGSANSVSLLELTELAAKATGKQLEIACQPTTRDADIPYYVTDNALISQHTHWQPTISVKQIVEEIAAWCHDEQHLLRPIFSI